MSDTVIRVENLSKKYILGRQKSERYTALRDVIANGVKNIGQRVCSPFARKSLSPTSSNEEFYALSDVSFEIKQGDRVGIIGRNGAGKSTLLKILSRITEPTCGRIEITGRVASLLEVGTGFHPELTGRENIFLNGAILGMSKVEIKRKFDEIVDFAEVDKFLDTPVKRYSSGMYVRLAFSVAAHLEPEILVVDEVLAVGDAQFQNKCLGRMKTVGEEGRTVIFVSHNMSAIQALCNCCIHIDSGEISFIGDVNKGVLHYMGNNIRTERIITFEDSRAGSLMQAEWLSEVPWVFEANSMLKIAFDILPKSDFKANLEVTIRNSLGIPVSFLSPGHFSKHIISFNKNEKKRVILETTTLHLASGNYSLDVSLCEPNKECFGSSQGELSFEVYSCDPYGTGFTFKSADNTGDIFVFHRVYDLDSNI